MKKQMPLALQSLLFSLGVLVYTFLVALIMSNGDKVFGKANDWIGPVAFLLLFVLSATTVGALVLGRPVYLYFDGEKKQAVKFLIFNIGWLLVITVIVFLLLAFWR
ncbi:MAG: hypothetical protein JW816_01485 [Candidatus Buchananbacteria bacterium]|nr:hypothetical protein [Candidatus Buchananbacteria bacterium]